LGLMYHLNKTSGRSKNIISYYQLRVPVPHIITTTYI
jgi:hypothetical protein